MPGIQIGVQLSSFGKPFRQALLAAAGLGVHSLEIDARRDLRPSELSGTALRQIRKLLTDLDMRVVAVRFQTRRGYDCTEELDRRVAATKDAMRMAADLGAPVVVNQIGLVPESPDDPSFSMLQQVLTDIDRHAQRLGAFLGCETGSEPLTSLARLVESLPEGTIGITLNPGNLIVNGFELEALPQVARHVRLVHAKDAVRDRARGRGSEVPLGRGLVEFPMLLAVLEENHYRGPFVIDRDYSPSIHAELKSAIDFLRGL